MKRKPVAMDLVCGKGGWSGDVADQDGRLKMFDSDDSATMAGYVSDRIQELSKKFRGKKVKVYQDPVTRLMPEGVGIIRAIALDRTANDDPPFLITSFII